MMFTYHRVEQHGRKCTAGHFCSLLLHEIHHYPLPFFKTINGRHRECIQSFIKTIFMKKAIYIWAICLVGLLLGTQSFGQRGGHGNKGKGHAKSRSYKPGSRANRQGHNYSKGKSTARYHNARGPQRKGHISARSYGPNHYGHGRKIVKVHDRRPVYRAAPWAARRHYNFNRHVYFPDYHAFYDARRRGYVYRNRGRWIFTRTIPSFMVGVNWNNVRLQYLQGVPVSVYPQTYYDTYVNRYPAVSLNFNVHL